MTKSRSTLLGLLVVSLALAWYSRTILDPATGTITDAGSRAFLNAAWGMSRKEVENANKTPLKETAAGRHFYRAEPGSESRYQALEAPGRFLARDCVVTYTFRDGKLVSYHVFVSDMDADLLDADMRRYLNRAFGPKAEEIEDGSALRLVWQERDRIVNYWFYEEPNALSRPYRAGFGVQNRST